MEAQALTPCVRVTGSSGILAGSGVTAGRSVGAASIAMATVFLAAAALLPLFSSTPSSIHFLIRARSSSGMGGESGGIFGSSWWVMSL